jgi:hypothetical protein
MKKLAAVIIEDRKVQDFYKIVKAQKFKISCHNKYRVKVIIKISKQ